MFVFLFGVILSYNLVESDNTQLNELNEVMNVTTPVYIINTSLPANESYKKICNEMKYNMISAFEIMIDLLPKELQPEFEDISMYYWNSGAVKQPYKSEIEYFSQCTGLTIKQIITVNLIYDLIAACTSIIALTNDNQIIHGRNEDFPTVLRNDTALLKFVNKNGELLYEGTSFIGYVGLPTGLKPNNFSISIDSRSTAKIPWRNIKDIFEEYFPCGWLVRECLMYDNNFDDCIKRLSNTKIMAPIYYIIAGINNGAVITRNQTCVNGPNNICYKPWYLIDPEKNQPNYGFYLIETNFDYWTKAGDNRRESAIKMMNSIGQNNINYNSLYNLLSTPPVLTGTTVYTSIMSPTNSYYYNIIRFNTTN